MRSLLLFLIRGYQLVLRPLFGTTAPTCRFYPTCSCYSHEAIKRYGSWRGLQMTITRVARCHPWNEGGYDPVEAKNDKAQVMQQTDSVTRLN